MFRPTRLVDVAKIVKDAKLKICGGGDHGLPVTYQDEFNAELVDFIKT